MPQHCFTVSVLCGPTQTPLLASETKPDETIPDVNVNSNEYSDSGSAGFYTFQLAKWAAATPPILNIHTFNMREPKESWSIMQLELFNTKLARSHTARPLARALSLSFQHGLALAVAWRWLWLWLVFDWLRLCSLSFAAVAAH